MTNIRILEKINKVAGKARAVMVFFHLNDNEESCYGHILGVSRQLLIMQTYYDFHTFDIKLIRLKDIINVRRSSVDITFDKILKQFDRTGMTKVPGWLKFGNWHSVCNSIKKRKLCVTIEGNKLESDTFKVGIVNQVAKEYVTFKCILAEAKWQSKPEKFKYNEIRTIGLHNDYCDMFYSFMINQ